MHAPSSWARACRTQVAVYEREGLSDGEIEARLAAQHLDAAAGLSGPLPCAVGSEVGARSRWGRLHLAAVLWHLDLEREFIYVGDGGFTELSGRTRRYGLDLEARTAITPWLTAAADVNLAHGRFRDAPAGADAIPLAPRFTSAGGLTAQPPGRFEGSLRYVHVGSRPANEDGSVTAEGYTVVHLLGAYRIGSVKVSAVVENVLDMAWNEAQFDTESRLFGEAAPVSELHFTPGNPRNIRLGVSYLF